MRFLHAFFIFLGLSCWSGTAYFLYPKYKEYQIRKLAEEIIAPYRGASREALKRRIANDTSDPSLVTVDSPGNSYLKLPAYSKTFFGVESLTEAEIEDLRAYLQSNPLSLGFKTPIAFQLRFVNQQRVGNKVYIRFQQVIQRRILVKYYVPLRGAMVTVTLTNGKLARVNTSLTEPPSLAPVFQNPGLVLGFSDRELARFISFFKSNAQAAKALRTYLDDLAKSSKATWWDYDIFMNRQLSEQREILNQIFNGLSIQQTARIFLQAARKNKLAFVRYGSKWMIEVTGFLDQPMQFDVEIPTTATEKLMVRNLRSLYHKMTEVRAYSSPYFPDEDGVDDRIKNAAVLAKMSQVVRYFNDQFSWSSFAGQNTDQPVEIHTQLSSIDFRENAIWLGEMQKFLIGEGGDTLYDFDNSISVLGHEYAHAILQFSSGLVYQGQAGALNEHFADIQGATISAMLEKKGQFDFTIGEDVLRPAIKAEKYKILDLILPKRNYSSDQIETFNLNRIGLRHLFSPELSFATQYDSLAAVQANYPEDCQPSIDNDNCGVHSSSGVPNKAAALIIAVLGLEQTRELFFKTFVYRLNSHSNFTEYLVQLFEECKETPSLENSCDVILASFAAVGVQHPQLSLASTQSAAPTSQQVQTFVEGPLTPSIRVCGWVKSVDEDAWEILDSKFNSLLVRRNFPLKTDGDYSALQSLKCACVQGQLTQATDLNGKLRNVFSTVKNVTDRGDLCSKDPRIMNLALRSTSPSSNKRVADSVPRKYCGWISVNSRSKNITLIDNRFDAAAVVSGYQGKTGGTFSALYKIQCGCVIARLGLAKNVKGTIFNYFKEISAKDIEVKPSKACSGIQWR